MAEVNPRAGANGDELRGASRATIVLGFASIGGVLGLVVGAIVGVNHMGMTLPDDAEYLPTAMLSAGAMGWLAGGAIGAFGPLGARPPGPISRRFIRAGAVVVLLGAGALAVWPGVSLVDGRWNGPGSAAFEVATLVGAAIVAATFLAVSLWPRQPAMHPSDAHTRTSTPAPNAGRVPGRGVGAVSIMGLLLGAAVFIFGLAQVPLSHANARAHEEQEAVVMTASRMVSVAADVERETGAFPDDLDQILRAGGRIVPGTRVAFLGVVGSSFCVVVGIDGGGDRTEDPRATAIVHPRAQGSTVRLGGSCTRPW
jgi:hypothetical protein